MAGGVRTVTPSSTSTPDVNPSSPSRRDRMPRAIPAWLNGYGALQDRLGPESASLLDTIEEVLHQRHRASSAIEGFNAALRPYLYVHKGATQGFLDLFRAWFNLRTRRWGRQKGTSAHECLTGQRVHDWLTLLGNRRHPHPHRHQDWPANGAAQRPGATHHRTPAQSGE